jgi:DNA-binding CsgD family transcriptional regulator
MNMAGLSHNHIPAQRPQRDIDACATSKILHNCHMEEPVRDFTAGASRLIAHLNTPAFPNRISEELNQLVETDLTAVLAYPMGQLPLLLYDGLKGVSAPGVMDTYLRGTYLLDACYVACTQNSSDGLYRLSDVAPDEFFSANYYNSPDVHPCISMESGSLAEELFYLCQPSSGFYLCFSLMRNAGKDQYSEREFALLQKAAPLVNALIARHWQDLHAAYRTAKTATDDPIEIAFSTFERDRLSAREQHIVSLILRGHSSFSIGNHLGIVEGTVKNHRKSIYSKLGISSQAELFAMFVRHALQR